ncbi:hypothetical protein B0H11DRAFT_2199031 [Mycena galericulata]|nr:hypothetical protein B0H11DRAFT_2199031 [Mycena galericulata]
MQHVVPRRGAWAVMTIDPLASLAHMDDPQIPEMCAKLVNKDYVVYVTDGNHQPFDPSLRYHEHVVEFLIQGLPPALEGQCIDSAMSIPIFPAASEHPWGRAPLRPSATLPWTDCYLSPFITATVRCPTVINDDNITHYLDIPEQLRHDAFADADTKKRDYQLERRALLSAGSMFTDDSDRSGWGTQSELESEDPSTALFRNAVYGIHPARKPVVTFTHDLSGMHQLYSPLDFLAEEDALWGIAGVSRLRRYCVIKTVYAPKPAESEPTSDPNRDQTLGLDLISGICQRVKNALPRMFPLCHMCGTE